MTGEVRLAAEGAIARVVLSHPGKLNAMSRAMWRQLRAVFEQLQREPHWRCVLVQGEGGAFCAGGDISEYQDFRFDEDSLRTFHEDEVWGGLRAMLDCDVPVVAAIRGACMGAGVELASCCDIRMAAHGASFGAPIARLGFPMAPREAAVVTRVAGEATARQLLLEAAVLDAGEMKARGFVQHLVAEAEFDATVQAVTTRIASLAPQAARLNKCTLRALHGAGPLTEPYAYAPSAEHREGVAAFLDKRKPNF